jgi:hypothetical protein
VLTNPIFLVGSERSGTTLTRLMLDHHPLIAFFFEFEYAVDMMPEAGGWPDMSQYHQFLETDRIFQQARLSVDKSLNYPQLIDSFLQQKRDRDGKRVVGATVHRHFDRLLRIWPDARFIHILRDGRDVARSTIEMGWAGNLYTASARWINAETLWSSLRGKLPAERWTDMRYETLVQQPVETLKGLCDFIGVAFDQAMLGYHKNSTYSLPSPEFMNQWKRKLSADEIRLAEARMGALLVERGYELSGLPPIDITPLMVGRLRLQDRWYTAMFSRRRYGTGLYLASKIARRFGPHSWRHQILTQMNSIDMQYLK